MTGTLSATFYVFSSNLVQEMDPTVSSQRSSLEMTGPVRACNGVVVKSLRFRDEGLVVYVMMFDVLHVLSTCTCDAQGTGEYVLRMAEEDWNPDPDFPGLDSSAVITDVGVNQFVLCHQVGSLAAFPAWVSGLSGV